MLSFLVVPEGGQLSNRVIIDLLKFLHFKNNLI